MSVSKKMLDSYLETMLRSSNDMDTDEPLDKNYSISDVSKEAIAQAKKDLEAFSKKAGDILSRYDDESIGHDFWLTRNGHGAGFWDGDYEEEEGDGDKLTEIAKEFGELNPMANDGEVIMESVKLAESVLRTIEKLESSPSKNEALLAEGTLRKDLKYRVKQDQDKKFYIQFQSKTTGGWIVANAKTFASQEAAHEYLKANKEK